MFGLIGAIVILIISSVFDIRWKKVPLFILIGGGVWAVLWICINIFISSMGETLMASAVAVIPGAGLIALSFLTDKKIGYGDGIIMMILGVLQGLGTIVLVFSIGLFLQSLAAVVLLIMKKADKQTCIPFIPFLLVAEILLLLL